MKNYVINGSTKVFTPIETIEFIMKKFKREGDASMFGTEQYEAMLEYRLVRENVPSLRLVIGGEEYILTHQKEKKLTNTERIEILEREVKELKEIIKKYEK